MCLCKMICKTGEQSETSNSHVSPEKAQCSPCGEVSQSVVPQLEIADQHGSVATLLHHLRMQGKPHRQQFHASREAAGVNRVLHFLADCFRRLLRFRFVRGEGDDAANRHAARSCVIGSSTRLLALRNRESVPLLSENGRRVGCVLPLHAPKPSFVSSSMSRGRFRSTAWATNASFVNSAASRVDRIAFWSGSGNRIVRKARSVALLMGMLLCLRDAEKNHSFPSKHRSSFDTIIPHGIGSW